MNNHRRDNFQGTNFDHFNIKSWRTKVNRIYRSKRFYCINISCFSYWTKRKEIYTCLLFFSMLSLFVGWSGKLKEHRANCQTISLYPVRFSTDIVNSNKNFFPTSSFGFFCFSIFFSFFCFLFLYVCFFVWNKKYIFWNTYNYVVGKWWKSFHLADFQKQYNNAAHKFEHYWFFSYQYFVYICIYIYYFFKSARYISKQHSRAKFLNNIPK